MHYYMVIDPLRGGRIISVPRWRIALLGIVVTTVLVSAFAMASMSMQQSTYLSLQKIDSADKQLQKFVISHVELRKALDQDRGHIHSITQKTDQQINALALRLSELQGQVLRMEAIGKRIADMAGIVRSEFDIETPVGLGGPIPATALSANAAEFEIQSDLTHLESRILNNTDKLAALESLLMDKHIQDLALPDGAPVSGGWIASEYGMRHDPFSGRREFHRGIDIAAKRGSRIVAVAPGMVIFSGVRAGYGNLIEIQHAEGFVTRYAHNKKNLVTVGERVQKNQAIAVIGSTGRSTGIHVHFEMIRQGVPINPRQFVRLK